ncbi:MAG TPA: Ig-like domain-containing protein [Chitinophaga sp.]
MNRNFGALAFWLVCIIASCFMTHCANIVPPSGGPKDTLPPVVLQVTPVDSSLHFNTHKVNFIFDEYVQLENVNEKLVVSPTLKRPPVVTAKLHTVTMVIKDTLQPNTTYTFNFADAIKDVNERNAVPEFVYVVSTGSYLDSLQMSGHIVNAETGRVDSNVAVLLYRNTDDSVVTKEKPVYYTKSRGDGSYHFKNLAPGVYKMFAIKEENKDLQYDDPAEQIAFPDSLVTLSKTLRDVNLLTFAETDTSLIKKEVDSSNLPEPPRKEKDKKKPRLQMGVNLEGGKQELTEPLHLTFNFPIRSIDTTRMELDEDTTLDPVNFTTTFDSTRTKLDVGYKWKSGLPYRLVVLPGFVVDTNNNSLRRADTASFNAKRTQDYGEVMVKLTLSDSMRQASQGDTIHYIVELVRDKQIKYSGDISKGTWVQHLVTPGDYEIRILLDRNNNGKWDRGVYYGTPKRQPERVVTFPDIQHIKANWLVKPDLRL